MPAPVDLNAAIKRLRYFKYQFLEANDFIDEQVYHRRMMQLHNLYLHAPGVAYGLDVDKDGADPTRVTVSSGVAIDGQGRLLQLLSQTPWGLSQHAASSTVYITLTLTETDTDQKTSADATDNTRTLEQAVVGSSASRPASGGAVVLAAVTLDGAKNVASIDETPANRDRAGSLETELYLRSTDPEVPAQQAVRLGWSGANQADVAGSLRLVQPAGMTGRPALTVAGFVAANTTAPPLRALDVTGQAAFRSATWTPGGIGVPVLQAGFDSAGNMGVVAAQDAAGSPVNLTLNGAAVVVAGAGGAERARIDAAGFFLGQGGLSIDRAGLSDGSVASNALPRGLSFGVPFSGEAIVSRRTAAAAGATANTNGLDFVTGFAPRLSIWNNGNVGIATGAAPPNARLEVKADANVAYPNPGTAARGGIHVSNLTGTNDYSTGLTFGGAGADVTTAQAGLYVQGSSLYGTRMYLMTTDSYAQGPKARLSIDPIGNVEVGTSVSRMAFGSAYAANLNYGTGYVGFNATRTAAGWLFAGDGSNNGGAAMWGAVGGNLYVATKARTSGANETIADTALWNNIRMVVQGDGNVGIGTNSVVQSPNTPNVRLHVTGGDIRWGNNARLVADQGGSLELGGDNVTAGLGTPYIDFHFGSAATGNLTQDYNMRLINDANGRLTCAGPAFRQNALGLSGGIGWSSISYNAHRSATGGWTYPDPNHRAITLELDDSGGVPRFEIYSQNVANVEGWTHRFRVDGNTGHVGIGTNGPASARLHVGGGAIMPAIGNSEAAGIFFPPDPWGGAGDRAFLRYFQDAVGEVTRLRLGIDNDADDRLALYQMGGDRLVIYNGNTGIGVDSPSHLLEVNGSFSAPGIGFFSDVGFKHRIDPLENSLGELRRLDGISYEWNPDAILASGRSFHENEQEISPRQIGFAAQQVEEVFPELVGKWEDPSGVEHRTVDYARMVPLLVEGIKELASRVEQLERR